MPSLGPCPPSNTSNKWPATIFAARRTARVPGRIIDLILSIMTITGIKAAGVPMGTRWAIFLLNCFTNLIIILPSHSGKERAKVILRWLEAVNTYGKSPKKLPVITIINTAENINITPGLISVPNTDFNSFNKAITINSNPLETCLFISQYLWGTNNRTTTAEIQFPANEKNTTVWGLNVAKRSPI